MLNGISLAMDCADVEREAVFWAAAMGYETILRPSGDGGVSDGVALGAGEETWRKISDPSGALPSIFFQLVPEAKTAKNRLHLDLDVGGNGTRDERKARIDAEAARLIGLGASNHRGATDEGDSYWLRMNDPEGNEFCLV